MALQVWLPLNGTLENKGLSNVTVTNNGATVDNNGKIGKCYSFDGNDDYIAFSGNFFRGGTSYPFSICMWIYQNDTNKAVLFGDYNLSGNLNFNIELRAATNPNVRFYWGGSPDLDLGTIPSSQWVHLCITYDGTTLKQYNNGTLVNSQTISLSNKIKSSGNFYIGRDSRTGATALAGKLNDVRIYDHALSVKEVKEISKGLILHYKLDGNDIGITIPRNGGLIPDEVELYDYILSSGTLWIDTGTKANLYPFKLDIEFMNHTSSGEKDVWGNINSSLGDKYGFVSGVSGLTFFQWGGSVWSKTGATVNQWHVVTYEYPDANNRNMIADGTSYTVAISNNNIILSNSNIYLFSDGPRGSMKFNGKIKYAKIYVGNVLKRNMLPCTYLGEPGMWDTVENKFYRNQGTGLFTLGNKITLKEYEYLQSSGTQWINTGVNGYMNHKYVLDYQQTGTGSYRVWGVFGQSGYVGYNMSITYSAGRCVRWSSTSSGTNLVDNIDTIANTDRHTFIIDDGLVYYDGINKGRSNGHSSSCVINYPVYLFTVNPANTTPSSNSRVKVYSYKDYDSSNKLIRDMIPVSYNGTPGLWDKVEWKFYANAGSGSFTLGPEKTVQQDAPIFYDSSGYCNHGSITGTLTTNNDSPRYTASTNIVNSYITTTSHPFNEITISFWINRNSLTGTRLFIYTDWPGVSIELTAANGWQVYYTYSSNQVISCIPTTTLLANKWYHIVYVIGTTGAKIYVDGVCENTSEYRTPYCNSTEAYIGHYSTFYNFNAKLSDFRIYATALSEDDVKELYNTSAFVTNNGVFAEYELYEDNLSDVKKTGLLETANFYENGAESGYALDTDKTRVASNYIISEEFIEI